MTEIRDATPPPGEWTDYFLIQIAERDAEIERLSNALSQRDAVLHWLAANNPSALELCPYKIGPRFGDTARTPG